MYELFKEIWVKILTTFYGTDTLKRRRPIKAYFEKAVKNDNKFVMFLLKLGFDPKSKYPEILLVRLCISFKKASFTGKISIEVDNKMCSSFRA